MKSLKKIAKIVAISVLFSLTAALLMNYVSTQFLNRLEYVTYDWRYRLKYQDSSRDEEFPDYGIHIVDIDERSMEKMGSYWSWDRSFQAKMVDSLSTHFPAAIAFDVLFYNPEDEKRYKRLAQTMNEAISGDPALSRYAGTLNDRLASAVNYDAQFERAIRQSGRVTLGLSLADESNYRDFTSQVGHRMDMEWHNSLNPASAIDMPDSLRKNIRHAKTIIDGIYRENARAAKQVGHVNIIDASSVVRMTPLLYRFGKFPPVYLPMSIRVAATLYGTPNDEIVFVPGEHIDIGKPFKMFMDADDKVRFSYPDFTETQFWMIIKDSDEIMSLGEGQKRIVSSYMALFKDDSGRACLETRSGRFSHGLTSILLNSGNRHGLDKMGVDDEKDIGNGFTARRDSDAEWEIYSDDEEAWLSAADVKTLSTADFMAGNDTEIADGVNRKLLTFDFWVKRENGILVSSLPVLRGGTLDELLAADTRRATDGRPCDSGVDTLNGTTANRADILKSIIPNGRRDFGKPSRIPLRRNNRHIVTYFGPKSKPFPYFSFYDIMENKVNYPMEGKIFIVGSTSPAMFDLRSAPHERVFPAVEIHATIMNSIFTDTYVRRFTDRQDLMILIAVGLAAALIAFLTKPFLGGLLAVVSLIVYAFAAFQLFDSSYTWIEMVRPMVAIIVAFTAVMIYRYITEEKNRKFLHSAFKQYLSPELIDMMYTQKQKPQLGGEEGVRTAFFTDIEGFSTFSERLGSPTRLVELLNEYLTAMTDILLARYGTLDKYVGDAIIAFFGAPVYTPDHAAQACHTALDMQKKLGELRAKWSGEKCDRRCSERKCGEKCGEKDKWPEIVHKMRMRVGINTGNITTGNMGSAVRMNYTMMGDVVNLAARLESAAKQYGVSTMISNFTHDLIKDKFVTRKLDIITVVGKDEHITVYELMCRKEELTKELSELLEIYNQGINYYYEKHDWEKARECFAKANELEPNRKISPLKPTPSMLLEALCVKYIENPPGDDWDGVNRLTSK